MKDEMLLPEKMTADYAWGNLGIPAEDCSAFADGWNARSAIQSGNSGQVPLAYFYPGDDSECKSVSLPEDIDDRQKANCIPLAPMHGAYDGWIPVSDDAEPPREGWLLTHKGRDYFYRNQADAVAHMDAAIDANDFPLSVRHMEHKDSVPSNTWIPVSERMPELYKFDIWVFSPSKGVVDGVSYDGRSFMDDECQFAVNDATHWMPKIYPDAPKGV